MKTLIKIFAVCALLQLFTRYANALPPEESDELCHIQGTVVAFDKREAFDDRTMVRFLVPVILVEVEGIVAAERTKQHQESHTDTGNEQETEETTGNNATCQPPEAVEMPQWFKGKKRVGIYRLCDRSKKLYPRHRITGTVGRTIGRGPVCIDQIDYIRTTSGKKSKYFN